MFLAGYLFQRGIKRRYLRQRQLQKSSCRFVISGKNLSLCASREPQCDDDVAIGGDGGIKANLCVSSQRISGTPSPSRLYGRVSGRGGMQMEQVFRWACAQSRGPCWDLLMQSLNKCSLSCWAPGVGPNESYHLQRCVTYAEKKKYEKKKAKEKNYSSLQPLFIRWKGSLKGTLELVIFSPPINLCFEYSFTVPAWTPQWIALVLAVDARYSACHGERDCRRCTRIVFVLSQRTLVWMQGCFRNNIWREWKKKKFTCKKKKITCRPLANLFWWRSVFCFFFCLLPKLRHTQTRAHTRQLKRGPGVLDELRLCVLTNWQKKYWKVKIKSSL